ncbi:MAG: S9 family peptidase [Beijerinckiaceae bacterium]|nr:S9 family peptidase [Beijerinckiaceae bacterium]
MDSAGQQAVSERLPSFESATPPAIRVEDKVMMVHGLAIHDEFAWLRAENWQAVLKDGTALPPEIKAHLLAENRHTKRAMRKVDGLRKQLLGELRGRIKEDDTSPPEPDGPFAYFSQFREGEEHPRICRQPRHGGETTILLDCERLARGKAFFDLGDSAHSPDHALIGWSVDLEGSEFYTIKVRTVATGRDRRDRIEMTDGSIVWSKDGKSFYYVRVDDNHRPRFVMRHRLGSPPGEDVVIHEEKSDLYFLNISETQSGAYGVINSSGHEDTEEWLFDLADPDARARRLAERQTEVLYDCDHHGDRLLIKTNADGAEDFKIVSAPLDDPERHNWTDFIPHRPGVMILTTLLLKDHFIRMERQDGVPRLVVHAFATGEEHQIAFDEEAFDLDLSSGYEFDTRTIRFTYSSMTTPSETYEYDLETRTRTLIKRQEIPSGHDSSRYLCRRMFARAKDGETIPISVLSLKDAPADSSAPCLLYAYGSYGYAMTPAFDSDPLSLVDRGFIYAIAHVRGGTEKGWQWYKRGKRGEKKNTFTDFIAVAEHLVEAGLTARGSIVAQGASAGGLLMGAVANMAPDLFAGLLAEVPFVDVLNTILDADLPLTPPEWPEWGNPIVDRAAFEYIRSYSPYDNVSAQRYPAILATGGLSDPRVTYWEPAKWVARIRSRMTGGGPILLKTNMDAGHGGASGRFEQLEEVAFAYAFAIAAVNAARMRRAGP